MMTIDRDFLDALSAKAKSSERLRMNHDLRTTPEDGSQRMLNALEPGTVLPIHRHDKSAETVVILRGAVREIFYDENGKETAVFELREGSDCLGLQIPLGQWHSLVCLEPGTVIFEAKDGRYDDNSMTLMENS